jgi:hypothetical protein
MHFQNILLKMPGISMIEMRKPALQGAIEIILRNYSLIHLLQKLTQTTATPL